MNRLRELRTKAKLTALELGSAIGAAESTVTAWERGTRQISPIQARAIIAALEARNVYVTLDTLYSAPAQAA
jgi:transcriptional regulator with XRE-family HTH domain